ncbi:MAG: HEAT repeat domain-containing protein [Desulfomonilaceae bacterium]
MFGSLFKPNVENLARNNNVKRLVECCKDGDAEIRERACKALREMDLRDPRVIGQLRSATADADANVKKNAVLALGLALGKIQIFRGGTGHRFVWDLAAGLETLIAISSDPDPEIRGATATALSQLYCTFVDGYYDTKGAECLLRLAEDNEAAVRVSARMAIHFWALESAKELKDGSSSSFAKMFEGSEHSAKLPDTVDEDYKAPFRHIEGLSEMAIERLGRGVSLNHEKLKFAQVISRSSDMPEIPDWQREFYQRIADYWTAWFQGKNL